MGDGGVKDFFDCGAAAQLLTYDLLRVVRTLGTDASSLARILHADANYALALADGHALVDPGTPVGQRCLRLVRLHRALGDAFGSTDAVTRFMSRADPEDGVVPAQLLEQPDGIERVFARLDCTGADEWRPMVPGESRDAGCA